MAARNLIVDIGMHDGKDLFYYAKRGYNVIAFEANPEMCSMVAARLSETDVTADVRNLAISDTPGEATFFVNRFNTTWSSLDKELGNRREGSYEITVQTCNLIDELSDVADQLYYVKIDIEGFDEIALGQVMNLDGFVPYISVENGSSRMLETLYDAGYSGFKFSNQRYVHTQKIPQNSPHGAQVEHTFIRSASGMFGEDLEGRWFTHDEAKRIITGLDLARNECPGNLWADAIGWFDLHAKHSDH